ncbi:MAG: DUF5011 domain-containing protein [Bacteroidales bacterium]|nr:DUF5011 domain-containing protein [Bacteroidales bacterium]
MTKKIYSILIIAVVLIALGCERKKESEGISFITYYPTFEIIGDNPYLIDVNDPPAEYVDEGANVTEQGEPIEYTTSGADAVDVNSAGVYLVTYSATNSDGYSASATRTVVVGCEGDDDAVITVTGNACNDYACDAVTVTRSAIYATWDISDVASGTFTVSIPGEVTILCGEVVSGSSAYGMYQGAGLDIIGGTLSIDWSYPPLGLASTTVIPITFE